MKPVTLIPFMKGVIKNLENQGRHGTAHVYRSVLKSITTYEGKDIAFKTINHVWLMCYEKYLSIRRLQLNTISTYMRVIRAVYNQAVYSKIAPFIPNLFKHVFTGRVVNHQRALTGGEMKALLDSSHSEDERKVSPKTFLAEMNWARACLELMLRFHGMPFVDLLHLRKSDLRDNYLVLCRRKTGRPLSVRVNDKAMELMKPYLSTDPASPYLLDFLDWHLEGAASYRNYQSVLRRLNHNLTRLAALCHIHQKVSSYSARHTWATVGKYCLIPIPVLSEGMGHASISTTEVYMKGFEKDKVEEANDIILNYIFNRK